MKRISAAIRALCLALIVGAGALAAGCSSRHDSPETLALHAMKCLVEKDIEGFWMLSLPHGTELTDEDKAAMDYFVAETANVLGGRGGLTAYEATPPQYDEAGGKAKVEVEMTYGDGTRDTSKLNLVKKDGKWYLSIP